jgi:hypothetical protein
MYYNNFQVKFNPLTKSYREIVSMNKRKYFLIENYTTGDEAICESCEGMIKVKNVCGK